MASGDAAVGSAELARLAALSDAAQDVIQLLEQAGALAAGASARLEPDGEGLTDADFAARAAESARGINSLQHVLRDQIAQAEADAAPR
jgi:hypothetical protein